MHFFVTSANTKKLIGRARTAKDRMDLGAEASSQRHVSCGAGERAQTPGSRLGQDANAFHPDPSRGQGPGRGLPLRSHQRKDH